MSRGRGGLGGDGGLRRGRLRLGGQSRGVRQGLIGDGVRGGGGRGRGRRSGVRRGRGRVSVCPCSVEEPSRKESDEGQGKKRGRRRAIKRLTRVGEFASDSKVVWVRVRSAECGVCVCVCVCVH